MPRMSLGGGVCPNLWALSSSGRRTVLKEQFTRVPLHYCKQASRQAGKLASWQAGKLAICKTIGANRNLLDKLLYGLPSVRHAHNKKNFECPLRPLRPLRLGPGSSSGPRARMRRVRPLAIRFSGLDRAFAQPLDDLDSGWVGCENPHILIVNKHKVLDENSTRGSFMSSLACSICWCYIRLHLRHFW